MEKTKKQHYVPQCYLRNFAIKGSKKKINVFDKKKEQVRLNQNILDNASERYFYDINIDKILEESSEEKRNDILEQLGEKYKIYKNDKEQHLEKFFSEAIESDYSEILKSIISKAKNATPWHIKNCYCMSLSEKILMSVCITAQFWRTKKQRVMLEEGIMKLYKTLIPKLYNIEYGNIEGKLSPRDIDVSIGKESMKLQHAEFILDIERLLEFVQVLLKHIWVVYINRTKVPFWTSDAPIALNSISDGCRSGKGIASKGIEIILPLSDKVALGMYEREHYEEMFSLAMNKDDRLYIEISDEEEVNRFNKLQILESYRCIFSSDTNFSVAEEMCKKYPCLKEEKEYFSIG